MSQPEWSLDPRLAADSQRLGDLALCRLLVLRDANYPWLVLVPRHAGAVEIIDLDAGGRSALMGEIAAVSRALSDVTRCDKLNVAALGNMVPQLHVHIIARFRSDAAWPGPVWGKAPATAYDPDMLAAFVSTLRKKLSLEPLAS